MKLRKEGHSYFVNNKRVFSPSPISSELVSDCFEFAYEMVWGDGHHRANRSGGQHSRKNGELFGNVFQGKLAEFAVHKELSDKSTIERPDLSIHGEGIWDDSDLIYKEKHISIKSAAFFSDLLLLETKDWNSDGAYIPNLKNASVTTYDYFVLVRIKPDLKRILLSKKLFYSDEIPKEEVKKIIDCEKWYYDIAGACSHKTIKHIIKEGYHLPQNALLNGSVKMDASNYYIQTGSLKSFSSFIEYLA